MDCVRGFRLTSDERTRYSARGQRQNQNLCRSFRRTEANPMRKARTKPQNQRSLVGVMLTKPRHFVRPGRPASHTYYLSWYHRRPADGPADEFLMNPQAARRTARIERCLGLLFMRVPTAMVVCTRHRDRAGLLTQLEVIALQKQSHCRRFRPQRRPRNPVYSCRTAEKLQFPPGGNVN